MKLEPESDESYTQKISSKHDLGISVARSQRRDAGNANCYKRPVLAQSGHRSGGGRATYSTGNPFKFDDRRRKLGGTRWWPQNKRWSVDEA
jgi:hypothetical protein